MAIAICICRCEQKIQYDVNVHKIMKIVVDNLYKDKDIFIRELISNSSDALGKLKASKNADAIENTAAHNYEITIRVIPETRQIVFKDTGIGMNEEELIKNLGTLANSGTEEFLKQYEANKEITNLQIGQFGMGFYSSFLVSDMVKVITKKADSDKYVWEAVSGSNEYVVRKATEEDDMEDPVDVGTKIILTLKEGGEYEKYLDHDVLIKYIKKNLGSISYPLYLYKPETITENVPVDENEEKEEGNEEENEEKKEGNEEEKEEKKEGNEEEKEEKKEGNEEEKKPKEKTVIKKEQLNEILPVWCRDPATVSEDDYNEFYKKITGNNSNPLAYSHFVADGMYSRFRGLIYIPERPSFQAFTNEEPTEFLSLYMKRVLITSEFKTHIKRHYAIIKGVVDVDALPLNVSRETLQETESLKEVATTVQKKTIALIQSISKDEEKYKKFIESYGNHLRLAILMDENSGNKDKLMSLLRFNTTKGRHVSLDEYIKRMVEGQSDIYYVSAQTELEAKSMPFIKPAIEKDVEVIYFTEIYDEHVINAVNSYKSHLFKSLAKAGTKLPGDEKNDEELAKNFEPLSKKMVKLCGSVIDKVEVSNILGDASMSVVASSYGWSPTMEKLMKGSDNPFQSLFGTLKKTLLINPKHPIVIHYNNLITNDSETDKFDNDLKVLFQIAMLRAGYSIQSPAALSERVEYILRRANNIDPNEKFDEITQNEGIHEDMTSENGQSNQFGMDGMDFSKFGDLSNMMKGFNNENEGDSPLDDFEHSDTQEQEENSLNTSEVEDQKTPIVENQDDNNSNSSAVDNNNENAKEDL